MQQKWDNCRKMKTKQNNVREMQKKQGNGREMQKTENSRGCVSLHLDRSGSFRVAQQFC